MAPLLLILCLPFAFGEQIDSLSALNDALASDPFNPQILAVHGELIEVIRETEEGLLNLKLACLLREADLALDVSNQSVFQKMESRDLVSWNAIIVGYVVGKVIHGYIIRYSCLYAITPVSNALVSFYAKCNDIGAAYQTFLMIPWRDLVSWNSILDAFAECEYDAYLVSAFQVERNEASALPIQVERNEASTLSIQVERNEASALPIQVEQNEASALPIQIEQKEASALPIQIEQTDVSHFRFKCSSFHQEGLVSAFQVERNEASALPIQVERNEASTLSIQVERNEASALPIQVERKETSALSIQIERKETSALPIQIEQKEASALPIQIEQTDVSHFRFKCSSFHQEG
ncbi:hypothetical protein F3Y22_tig00112281pilonHSYRG00110 [Hibiscus syriacus]|uniref:Uncharacterized protein n=1 Tax=Hibiscus syriacus TaxID=106335 RepID=A0A6A2X272_HIBSY|nr:hypothetical protein F3Y22_tig00112281pilonHSYRG00110 [Hibiscus syriacus]